MSTNCHCFKTLCYVAFISPCYPVIQVNNVVPSSIFSNYRFVNLSTVATEPPWRVIFFGTDDFALKSVQPLCAKLRTGTLLRDVSVVARPASVVRKFAEAEKLPVIEWPFNENVIENKFDIGVIVSFGHLIPKKIIEAIPLGILNVHGSILPRWRGAAPILYAVMNGDLETGVTIMKIDPYKFDTGSIVRQLRCSVGPDETTPQLTARLADHGAKLLMECFRDLPRCLAMATPQPEHGVTYAPRVSMELSVVNWTSMGAKQVYDLHRAISHIYALTTSWHGAQTRLLDIKIDVSKMKSKEKTGTNSSVTPALNFLNAQIEDTTTPRYFIDTSTVNPGKIFYNKLNKTMKIQCGDGVCVSCTGIRMGGKKFITPHEFYNGYLSKVDTSKWYFS